MDFIGRFMSANQRNTLPACNRFVGDSNVWADVKRGGF